MSGSLYCKWWGVGFVKHKYRCSNFMCGHVWSTHEWEEFYRYYYDSKPCPKCNRYYSIYANFTDQEKAQFKKDQLRLQKELENYFNASS